MIATAEHVGEIRRDKNARELWQNVYGSLSEGEYGLVGAVLARAEAQAMRLACLYALLDHSDAITVKHLQAALAVWKYCEHSVRSIFGSSTGHRLADQILRRLWISPDGMSRTDIRDLFNRNRSKPEIDEALAYLQERELACPESVGTHDGRPTEMWFAVEATTERQNVA